MSSDLSVPARRNAWAASITLFVIMAGHTVLETARDSLFLARMPVSQLPFTYLAIAVAALFAAELNGRVRHWLDPRRALALTLLVAAVGSFWFLRLFRLQVAIAPQAFYVWVAVMATLAIGLFWLMLSELFTVGEAKRSFAAVSAGGLLGAVAGGALARYIAGSFKDTFLIVVGAALFCVAALFTLGTCTPRSPHATPDPLMAPSEKAVRGPALRDLRSERYLRRLLLISIVATLTSTLIDYSFKAQVARTLAPTQLAQFRHERTDTAARTFRFFEHSLLLLVERACLPLEQHPQIAGDDGYRRPQLVHCQRQRARQRFICHSAPDGVEAFV